MPDVKMKATKVIYTKVTGQVDVGAEFQVEASRGRELEKKGFAEMIGDVAEKSEEAPENKMEPVAENKATAVKRSKAKEE